MFELDELRNVANLLANDASFLGLNITAKILFKYNIHPLEITRIQIKDINWEKGILTLPPHKTKNGNEATFLMDNEIINLLKLLIEEIDSGFSGSKAGQAGDHN